jgi:thiol-disulfide isomerase/thioredoxin
VLAVAISMLGRRLAPCAIVLAWCFALTGCSLLSKRPGGDRPSDAGSAGVPPAKFPTGGDPLTGTPNTSGNNQPTSQNNQPITQTGAMLAGRVIDGFSRPPANTSIRWGSVDDKNGAEQEVAVTPEGYFTIQGLKPGGQYKLVARGKQGERLVAGITQTTAPNIRVLIQVKEEFAGSATPPLPAHPGAGMDDPSKTTSVQPPGWNGGPNTAFPGTTSEPVLPTSINIGPQGVPASSAPANNWTPGGLVNQGTTSLPLLEIPRTKPAPPPPSLQIPNSPPPPRDAKPAAGFPPAVAALIAQARVPCCVRAGDKIEYFALNDVNGRPWDLRQRKGKLVLVDFWGTWCGPCLSTLPYLQELHTKYGGKGLEIVGIANERFGTSDEEAYGVYATCKRYSINYRQLLGSGSNCPVLKEFRVNGLPSLFLLDEQGFIVWRREGADPDHFRELELHIQHHLNKRVH